MNLKKAEDFISCARLRQDRPQQVVNKVLQRLKTEQVAEEEPSRSRRRVRSTPSDSDNYGINVHRRRRGPRAARKVLTPVPGDEIVGTSRSEGINPRGDCRTSRRLRAARALTPVTWDGGAHRAPCPDRGRVLGPAPDCSRTWRYLADTEPTSSVRRHGREDQMARNWYVAEVGDVKELRGLLTALRNVEAVFDAYRVTPS